MAEPANEAGAILRIIGVGARVDIHQVVFERAIDEDGELACGGGDGFGLSDAEGHPPIERTECGSGTPEIHGAEAEDGRGAIRRGLRPAAKETPAGDLVLGGERQPRGEVLLRGPARHVGANLRQQAERVVRPDAVNLGQVDAGELVQRRPDIETREEVYGTMQGPEWNVTGNLKDWDVTDRLRELALPVLITSGKYDEMTPALITPLVEGIRGAESVLFEESAHLAMVEEPERYRQAVESFLSRVEARRA